MSKPCSVGILAGCLAAIGACADGAPDKALAPSAQLADCSDDLNQDARRPGESGLATLLYPCDGDACTGREAFAKGLGHSIAVEVLAGPEASVILESADPQVFNLADQVSTYDPCAGRYTAWATLEAKQPGVAVLRVRDANGPLDDITVRVASPSAVVIRATPIQNFAFEAPGSPLLAAEGESWLLLPELYDGTQGLLVGLPPLTWEVDDPAVAEVRVQPETDSERSASGRNVPGLVFLRAKQAGETAVRVNGGAGVQAGLKLRVVSP